MKQAVFSKMHSPGLPLGSQANDSKLSQSLHKNFWFPGTPPGGPSHSTAGGGVFCLHCKTHWSLILRPAFLPGPYIAVVWFLFVAPSICLPPTPHLHGIYFRPSLDATQRQPHSLRWMPQLMRSPSLSCSAGHFPSPWPLPIYQGHFTGWGPVPQSLEAAGVKKLISTGKKN